MRTDLAEILANLPITSAQRVRAQTINGFTGANPSAPVNPASTQTDIDIVSNNVDSVPFTLIGAPVEEDSPVIAFPMPSENNNIPAPPPVFFPSRVATQPTRPDFSAQDDVQVLEAQSSVLPQAFQNEPPRGFAKNMSNVDIGLIAASGVTFTGLALIALLRRR